MNDTEARTIEPLLNPLAQLRDGAMPLALDPVEVAEHARTILRLQAEAWNAGWKAAWQADAYCTSNEEIAACYARNPFAAPAAKPAVDEPAA